MCAVNSMLTAALIQMVIAGMADSLILAHAKKAVKLDCDGDADNQVEQRRPGG